ncbi:MAG: thioredoxin [Clostridia bacterium]|nr:thioredoxin [Clostridia bacterium]
MVKHINQSEFETLLKEEKLPIVVDFWATWCGPCKMLGPVLEEVSKEYEGKAVFVKIDVDENMELAQKYGISSIPNVLFFKDGVLKDNSLGFAPKSVLASFVEKNL